MKTLEQIQGKIDEFEIEVSNLEALKQAAIDSYQYQVANSCKMQIGIRKRDIKGLEWVIKEEK